MANRGEILLQDPVNRQCGLTRGLASWWMPLPGVPVGLRLRDLCDRSHGAVAGNPDLAAGVGGMSALKLDGAGDYVTLASTADSFPTDEATLAVWCRFRVATPASIGDTGFVRLTTTSNSTLSTHYPYTNGAGYFNTFLNSRVGPVTMSSAVVRTNWHLITVTSTPGAGGWAVYQNNALLATSTGQASIDLDEANGLWLGRSDNPSAGGAPFEMDGHLGGAMLWTRALSAAEIAAVLEQFRRGHPDTLRRLPRRTVYVPAAPPSGFQPAWARGSNSIITGGVG